MPEAKRGIGTLASPCAAKRLGQAEGTFVAERRAFRNFNVGMGAEVKVN
jgi:hypothetical protein